MTGLAISKPWLVLTEEAIAALPGQLGVFELKGQSEVITRIGYAGGREPFGLRSALASVASEAPDGETIMFRYELTSSYLTRWEELLMVHKALHGHLPEGNADHLHPVGRLRLG